MALTKSPLAKALEDLHNDIIQNHQPRYGYNFEGKFEKEPRYLLLAEEYGVVEREYIDDKQCGPDTWQVWTFITDKDEEVHIKVTGESIINNEYTTWKYAYEVMPVEISRVEWVMKHPGKGALNPDER